MVWMRLLILLAIFRCRCGRSRHRYPDLSNAGGAKSTDFIDALHLVRYMNTALNPTAGPRTIEVQFTTASGGMSNVAIAYIQVNELPPLEVDLGPDQIICEGSSAF